MLELYAESAALKEEQLAERGCKICCLPGPEGSCCAICRNVHVPGAGPDTVSTHKRSAAPELHQTRAAAVRHAIAQASAAQPAAQSPTKLPAAAPSAAMPQVSTALAAP